MRIQRFVFLVVLILVTLGTTPAAGDPPYCGPCTPYTICSQECLICGPDAGDLHQGFPLGSCDNPSVTTYGELCFPCS